MIITNRLGLPDTILNAIKNDPYSSGGADISVSSLIKPPRQVILAKRHDSEITRDAVSFFEALLGQGTHAILERGTQNSEDLVLERRLFIDVEGWKVSGAMDVYDKKKHVLYDYKITNKDGITRTADSAELQLNCYAVMLRAEGHRVEKIQIIVILRDWYRHSVNHQPESPILTIDIPLWAPEKAEKYLRERVILHQQSLITMVDCTPEERLSTPASWGVYKRSGEKKRASKVFYNEGEAEAFAAEHPKEYDIQLRPAGFRRCQFYCDVAPFCDQYLTRNK